ncbi:hypothetical protein [Streptomyces ficellus]
MTFVPNVVAITGSGSRIGERPPAGSPPTATGCSSGRGAPINWARWRQS